MTSSPKKPRKKQIAPLSVRFSKDELQLLEELAALSDISIRAYVKKAALNGKVPKSRKRTALSREDKKLLFKVYGALRQSSLVKTFNIIGNALVKGQAVINVVEKAALLNACADIKTIRLAIEKALNISL
jgi:uncharacterized protein (DUF1778 family)